MDFRILGPFEVVHEGRTLALGGPKQRALLAVLVLDANRVVSSDRLIDALWVGGAPIGAAHTIQVYVSRLRKALREPDFRSAEELLRTEGQGYVLHVDADEVDLHRFEEGAAEGRRVLARGEPELAASLLREAIALFRGPPLADLAYEAFAQPDIARIEELRLSAVEDRIEADLALGRHGVVGELRALMSEHPLRERPRAQLMLALYRAGRQAEALQVSREGRAMLAEELGIDPMPELQRLEQAILHQDRDLDLAPRPIAGPVPSTVSAASASPPSEPSAPPPMDPGTARSERKFAAALFADLVGSTALAEREDPEVVRSVVGRAFERLVREIERYGGVPEKFVGDAVLAVFGVPAAHEDDAERAVRAALDMQSALSDLNRDLAAEGRAELSLRIGIEAGDVLVELDRVTGPRDRMLTGDAVNTAARLQAVSEPGQVVVGPGAHAAAKTAIEFRDLPPFTLKGKVEAVPAWRALGAKAHPRGERAASDVRARLIGRDEELALLVQTFHRVAAEGRPALVTILGPAGVGKSRLVSELSRRLETLPDPVSWRKGRCLAYGNLSYSALAEAVKAECGVLEDDAPVVVAQKSARTVQALFGKPDLTPLIEVLVGSGLEHSFSREELFDAWRAFLERVASRAPLVLQLEDVHWADDGVLDFVDHVADWAEGRLLLVTLARPELLELRPGWGGGKRNYSVIYLDPLAPEETEVMLEDLLSMRLPPTLARLVVDRSEGNPLFTEELVRVLIDRGVLRSKGVGRWELVGTPQEIDVPRSIQALIATRLDSLPPDEKAVIQDAAVVGRTFWMGTVQRLSDRSRRETKDLLGTLRVKGILVSRDAPAFSGESEFAFHHVLIRDVAYEGLPKSLRAVKHIEVARWAEEHAGERRQEIAELLATHYAEALRYRSELGEPDLVDLEAETLRWARAAAERAQAVWQLREGARWYRLVADLADRADLPMEERAATWESYARAAEAVDPYPTVATAFEHALALYGSLERDADAGRIESWLAHVAFQSGDEEGVLRWAGRALEHLEPFGDSRDLALALVYLGWYHHRLGRDADAEPQLRRAMAIAEHVGDRVVHGRAMLSLGMLLYKSLRAAEGMALLDSALELARRSGDLPFLLRALLVVSEGLEVVAGDYRRAEALVREGLDLARRAGHIEQVAWMQGNLSDYLVDMGRLEEAETPAREGLEAARSTGELPRIGYSLLMLSFLLVLRSELEEAERLLVELRPVVEHMTETYHEGWVPLIEAYIARAKGDEARATAVLLEGARRSADRLEAWAGQLLLLDCVRSLVKAERGEEAEPFRKRLSAIAEKSVPTRAFLTWCDGLLDPDSARARQLLADAADRLESLERRVDHGRCLVDLAEAERRLGQDPTGTLDRARETLESSGATIFLRELDARELNGRS
ncbi:MAG: BTAD domain-containing putative transcriptional regulator [Actinomycetota bacterium]